ncbi:MAG: hypothetical protein ACREJO_00480 [Phycisphaerales bacterium]
MPQPSPSLITSTRWRSADALLAIAEDPKASARERRLAAMAVLDLCDKAEATLQAPSAASSPAVQQPAVSQSSHTASSPKTTPGAAGAIQSSPPPPHSASFSSRGQSPLTGITNGPSQATAAVRSGLTSSASSELPPQASSHNQAQPRAA